MEQEVEETRTVYTTIDDVINDQGLVELLEAELGHEPDREMLLALAHECSEYDEEWNGFVLKPGFGPDDDGSLVAWEDALAEAEEEEDSVEVGD